MSRTPKCRRVARLPEVTYFKPAGIPLRALEEVRMTVEEAEALRLKDLEDLEQEQGAEMMNVSRPTFQRILSSARHKITDALLNGKAVRIVGGNYEMTWCRFRCGAGHEWELATPVSQPPDFCPECRTSSIEPLATSGPCHRAMGHGQRRRAGRGRT